jgi:hypothetical protein
MDEEKKYTTREYVLFKLDRTVAIIGIIVLGGWSLAIGTPESVQIGIAAVGGLIGYIGGRTSSR